MLSHVGVVVSFLVGDIPSEPDGRSVGESFLLGGKLDLGEHKSAKITFKNIELNCEIVFFGRFLALFGNNISVGFFYE